MAKTLEEKLTNSKIYKTLLGNLKIPDWAIIELNNFSEEIGYTCDRRKTFITWIKYNQRDWVLRWREKEQIHSATLEYQILMRGAVDGEKAYIKLNKTKTRNIDFTTTEQRRKSLISANKKRGKTGVTCRSVDWWLSKGFTLIESKEKVREIQSTNSLKRYVKKYGQKDGTEKFNNRKESWKRLMQDPVICKKRSLGLWRYIERYGVEIGTNKYIAMRKKVNQKRNNLRKASNESVSNLQPVIELLNQFNKKYFIGIPGNKEWCIVDGVNTYFYDLAVPRLGIIIEYQGKCFHPSINLTETARNSWKQLFTNKSANEIIGYDNLKRIIAESNGWKMFYVYPDNLDEDIFNICSYIKSCSTA